MNQKSRRIMTATLGTFLEWAEFSYYAYIASEISKLFFPQLSIAVGLLATFSVFAISYFFRPLGALLFGYIGDQFGRKLALQSSIILMGLASCCIGLLPTYQSLGIIAPILLFVFRSIQGLAVSGELNGCAIYLIEHDLNKPCLAASWTAVASASGMMFGSLMSVLIYLPNMPAWAWRIPFLLGTISCFCGLYFRNRFTESPEFLKFKVINNPITTLIRKHSISLLKAMTFIAATGVYLYTMNVYYGIHLAKYTTLSPLATKIIVTTGQALVVIFILILARVADNYNEQRMLALGLKGFFIVVPLAFIVPMTDAFSPILLVQIGYAACDALVSVPLFKMLNDLFPVNVRYTGISVAWSISMATFGGTAPLVVTYLQDKFNTPLAPVCYILLPATLALIVLYFMRKKAMRLIQLSSL